MIEKLIGLLDNQQTLQTIIGSAVGPFFAIILSAISFWFSSVYKNSSNRDETIRLVEISITRTINDMNTSIKRLEDFTERLLSLAKDARKMDSQNSYFLEKIGFPALGQIFFNDTLLNLKSGSTYLHNKILFTEPGIREINNTFINMEKHFENLMQRNEFLMVLSPKPSVVQQRNSYAENLEIFAHATNSLIVNIKEGMEMLFQIKTYNLKLLRKRIRTIITNEKDHFKFFWNKTEHANYNKTIDIITRIDSTIDSEVQRSINGINQRKESVLF